MNIFTKIIYRFDFGRLAGINCSKRFGELNSIGVFKLCFFITLLLLSLFFFTQKVLALDGNLAKGKALYEKHCAVCHGPEGKGDGYTLLVPPPTDLTSDQVKKKSYDALWHEVHDGIPDTAMGTWKLALSDSEITMVIEYVRSLPQ